MKIPFLVRGIAGAVVGGALGYALFVWLVGQGFYALALPGALAGMGCGALSGRQSLILGAACGLAGLALGVLAEWRVSPFLADASLTYFVTHLGQLQTPTLVLIAAGAGLGFWFGRGRAGGVRFWVRNS